MRRFLSSLASAFRTTNTARTTRRAPHRASLQLEGLEDRLALSTTPYFQFLHVPASVKAGASFVLTPATTDPTQAYDIHISTSNPSIR
jgi:hypothetical protein